VIRGKPKTRPAKLRFPIGTLVELTNGTIYEVICEELDNAFHVSGFDRKFSVKYTHNKADFMDIEPNRVFRYSDLRHSFDELPPIARVIRRGPPTR
jgi:hypothetical protein